MVSFADDIAILAEQDPKNIMEKMEVGNKYNIRIKKTKIKIIVCDTDACTKTMTIY